MQMPPGMEEKFERMSCMEWPEERKSTTLMGPSPRFAPKLRVLWGKETEIPNDLVSFAHVLFSIHLSPSLQAEFS